MPPPRRNHPMPIRLDSQSADFASRFAALLAAKRETAEDVEQETDAGATVRLRKERLLLDGAQVRGDTGEADEGRVPDEVEDGLGCEMVHGQRCLPGLLREVCRRGRQRSLPFGDNGLAAGDTVRPAAGRGPPRLP